MTEGVALEDRGAPAAPACRHHWLIESPQGATSWGTCKLCGEQREFVNSAYDALWDREGIPGSKGEPATSYGARIISSREDDEGL